MGNVNLVLNPSFETNTTSWIFTGATATRDTVTTGGTGTYSAKLVATGSAPMSASITVSGLTVGVSYTTSFYVATLPITTQFSVVPAIDGVFTPRKVISSTPYFQRRYIGFVATATSAVLSIRTENNATLNDTMWIDRVQVTAGPLTPYFDGTYPFCTWSGTAHGSTSTCSALASSLVGSDFNTDEIVIVNGLVLNTVAWNITTKTGRYNPAQVRGENLVFPGMSGRTFVPNKPIDDATWALSMFLLGQNADGTIPSSRNGQRAAFEYNYQQLLRQVLVNNTELVAYAWTPTGAVRTARVSLMGVSPDVSLTMGGVRSEFTLAFDVLSGFWSDYIATTVTGTASSAWSNQSLTLTALAGGTVAIDDSVVTVTGPITNPRVTNAATGTWVQYTGSVPSGQTWVIDSNLWTSKVNGVSVLANTTHFGHARFLLIAPGDYSASPSITLTGSGTSSATNISVTATRKHYYA